MNALPPSLVLASRSPRRAELLRTLGVDFVVVDVGVDETPQRGETASAYVRRLAQAKASAGRAVVGSSRPVLAADTTVVCDDEILGKPLDAADARRILSLLAGRWHRVLTGVVLAGKEMDVICVQTSVLFRALSRHEIDRYWESGEPTDKAGAYGIQGLGGAFVTRLDGSYSNVVGLPLAETLSLLDKAGIAHRLT